MFRCVGWRVFSDVSEITLCSGPPVPEGEGATIFRNFSKYSLIDTVTLLTARISVYFADQLISTSFVPTEENAIKFRQRNLPDVCGCQKFVTPAKVV
jgi:hypothetical protein